MTIGVISVKVTGDRNNSGGVVGANTQRIGLESANIDNSSLDKKRKCISLLENFECIGLSLKIHSRFPTFPGYDLPKRKNHCHVSSTPVSSPLLSLFRLLFSNVFLLLSCLFREKIKKKSSLSAKRMHFYCEKEILESAKRKIKKNQLNFFTQQFGFIYLLLCKLFSKQKSQQ